MKYFFLSLCLSVCVYSAKAQQWRNDAEAKIEKHRKASLKIQAENIPSSGDYSIQIRQKKQAFRWGSTANIKQIQKLTAQGAALGADHPYYHHLLNFNSITVENTGKWIAWNKPARRETYRELRQWLRNHHVDNRGHGTIWESTKYNAVPKTLLQMTDTAEIRRQIYAHIDNQLEALADEVYELDLVNEPVHEDKIVKDILKVENFAQERANWYNYAKAKAPNLPLVINEFHLIQNGNDFHLEFGKYLQEFLAAKGTVDVIGMQGHFYGPMPDAQEIQRRIDEVSLHGIPMHVTEFDMADSSYTAMERVLYLCFAEPLMTGFTLWGAWDGNQWRDSGAIYKANWDLKESGKAYYDLVHGQWRTDLTYVPAGTADSFSVFKGDYDIIVTHQGKSKIYPVKQLLDDTELRVDFADVHLKSPTINFTSDFPDYLAPHTPLQVVAKGKSQDPIKTIQLLVNGYPVARRQFEKANSKQQVEFTWAGCITGENRLQLEITTEQGLVQRSAIKTIMGYAEQPINQVR